MVARIQITTTVASDGSVRLLEHEIEPAGIRAGDRVRIEIVKESKSDRLTASPDAPDSTAEDRFALDVEALARLPFDEWLERFRADFPVSDDTDVEALIRQGEEAVAQEFWERLDRHG